MRITNITYSNFISASALLLWWKPCPEVLLLKYFLWVSVAPPISLPLSSELLVTTSFMLIDGSRGSTSNMGNTCLRQFTLVNTSQRSTWRSKCNSKNLFASQEHRLIRPLKFSTEQSQDRWRARNPVIADGIFGESHVKNPRIL